MLHPGLYEQVINNALNRELSEVPEACKSTAPIDTAEASKVLAQYLTEVVQKGLDNVQDNGGGIEAQIELANQIVSIIQTTTKEADFAALGVDRQAEQLLALLWKMTHALPPESCQGHRAAGNVPCAKLIVYRGHPRAADVHRVEEGDRIR